ncbi:TINAGL1 family protein [Megaselia abdita]
MKQRTSRSVVLGLQVFLGLLSVSLTLARSDLRKEFPGPYCQKIDKCCNSRQDECATPIADTICYCDDFCDRGIAGDCCPDYESYCRNVADPITSCIFNKTLTNYNPLETFKDGCNDCTCLTDGSIRCSQEKCLTDDTLVRNVNMNPRIGWTATEYPDFITRKWSEGQLRCGPLKPSFERVRKITHDSKNLPREFKADEKWPGLISAIEDQGWCASSWIVSATSMSSDRFAIISNGQEQVKLASQQILACTKRQQGCDGGYLDAAWSFLNKFGVVDETCYPYEAERGHCRIHPKKNEKTNLREAGCRPVLEPRTRFYTMGPAYPLATDEKDIMAEILQSGPVQATFRVYRDFFSYKGGIYKRSAADRDLNDFKYHAVKIVGWGEEFKGYSTEKYWVCFK